MWSIILRSLTAHFNPQDPLTIIDLASPPICTMASICKCPPSLKAPPDASLRANKSPAGVDGDLVVHPHVVKPVAVKPPSDHYPLATHLALKPSVVPSSGGPPDSSKSIGAIVDVVPTDGANINRLPPAVKRYTERDDFYPSSTEVKSNLYGGFRAMHNKQDDQRTTDIVTIRPHNPVNVSYRHPNIGPLQFEIQTWSHSCQQRRSFIID